MRKRVRWANRLCSEPNALSGGDSTVEATPQFLVAEGCMGSFEQP